MMQRLHRLACLAALVCLASGVASAAPPDVTFELVAPAAALTPGDYVTFELRYSVVGANLSDVDITWDLPPGLIPLGAGAAGDFDVACTWQTPTYDDWTCTWHTAAILVPGGGVSGALPVGVKFLRWAFADGTVVPTSATLAASWSDGATTGTTGPHLASTSVALEGQADLAISRLDWEQTRTLGFGFIDGVPGKTSAVLVAVENAGTVGVAAGSTIAIALPPDARLISFTPHSGSPALQSAIGAAGPVVVEAVPSVGSNQITPSPTFVYEATGAEFTLLIWRPCTAEPYAPSERVGATWTGAVLGHAATTLAQREAGPGSPLVNVSSDEACASPAALTWGGSSPQIGPGRSGQFNLAAKPPGAVAEAYDVFFSVVLPSNMVNAGWPRVRDSAPEDLVGARVFLCSVPGDSAPFTAAEFAAVRNTPACTERDANAPRPDATHAVAVQDTWGEATVGGVLLWRSLTLELDMYLATCSADAIAYAGYLSYHEAGGPLVELTATHAPVVEAQSYPFVFGMAYGATATRGASQTLRFGVNAGSQFGPPLNPALRVTIPPGVRVVALRSRAPDLGCSVPPPLIDDWAMDGNTLVVRTGDATHPWYLNDTSCVCSPSGLFDFELDLEFDAAYPFVNGQQVDFLATVTADNITPVWIPNSQTVSLAMLVPPEMRFTVEPACDPSSAAYPSFRVGWANSGGVPLADAEAVFEIPSGTTLVDVTSGASIDCFDGLTWGACTASAQRVRAAFATLAPHTSGSMFVRLDTAAAPGTLVYGDGSLTTTSGLAPIVAAPQNPVIVGSCPGQLDLQAWWDDTHPGTLDPGELAAAGWAAVVQHTQTGDSVAITLGVGGFASTALAPGVYTLTFVPPGDLDASWTILQPPPATVTIVATQTTYVGIGVSCGCDDDDVCTGDVCSRVGVCSHPEVPGCSACEPEPGCPAEGGRIFGEVATAAGPRSFRCTFVPGGAPECEVERDGAGAPILSGGHPVLALFDDLVCE